MPFSRSESLIQTDGFDILVRVPTNYHADIAHPLLVVYAAAGMTAAASERYTGFTPLATRAGYVVAYPQHLGPSLAALRKLARVPAAVSARVCIDQIRVYLTGHSDGGTAATAIAVAAVQPASTTPIAALAPSAAGFTSQDLAGFKCPSPRPVMVWHGATDRLFPGWGRAAAAWWAQCNHCESTPVQSASPLCVQYPRCAAAVIYCEHPGGHTVWPKQAAPAIIEFFNMEQS